MQTWAMHALYRLYEVKLEVQNYPLISFGKLSSFLYMFLGETSTL